MSAAHWITFGVVAVALGAVAVLKGEAVWFLVGLALAYMLIAGGLNVGWSPW